MQKTIEINEMTHEVLEGLSAAEKYISSKYFYDAQGSRIFQRIMRMPEYYPTRCEAEIFQIHKHAIASLFCNHCFSVDLVELGAGDGQKTKILIRDLLRQGIQFRYIPVDISEEAVGQLAGTMNKEFSGLAIESRVGDYFHMLADLSREYPNRKVVMFLGSNLGNFDYPQSISFLSQIGRAMSSDDIFFIGLDLKKDPEIIRRAYDDPHGHTRDFNLNLLSRLNSELGADFNLDRFVHAPSYDPVSGTARSYLVSTSDQKVSFRIADETIFLHKWEAIFTEMSQKYDLQMVFDLADKSGFSVVDNFFDSQHYFVNSLWKKKL